ncbi:L,D-transpeptidase family protein [Flavihumibacter rivuli]|uniref:L,D-transpeptidase family protein n=1 Tax=Flavihumibacter rivuli TaxID=2838156 RepID=UPI001BDDCF70|nr:L,D-transpeptidase family protein [Flavihumibacter rivuli]ULQ57038.1 L,D-transpeptidase family protein [Flavihumibacter rivuli]
MKKCLPALLIVSGLAFLFACGNPSGSQPPEEVVIVKEPEQAEAKAHEQIRDLVSYLDEEKGKLNDSVRLPNYALLSTIYEENNYQPLWSEGDRWKPSGDSLFFMISKAKLFGLFPSDYHLPALLAIRNKIVTDTLARKNIALWCRADLLLSDGFLQMARHLKQGHLQRDSVTLRNDSLINDDFYLQQLRSSLSSGNIVGVLESLEPVHPDYKAIRAALPAFLDSVKFREYTYIQYPNKDSIALVQQVAQRLQESGLLNPSWEISDSTTFFNAVRSYQKSKGIRTTGRVGDQTVKSLNSTDWDKFRRIAVNLDRYRQLPEQMPLTYLWVNIPAYQLTVMDGDSIAFRSKVIVGTPKNRTPVLNSEVVNFITYPQWTVPYSIIFKEMLPKIQKDIRYLAKQNLMVVDKYDSVINPANIDWSKLSKTNFPYLLRQRQGDDNSLGVMKFNFRNKYAVYLHDTNARGLFSRSSRALSHGCVRVQDWEKLSHFLVRDDTITYHTDTLRAWIQRQEKHVVSNFPRVPIFIRYFTVEAVDGKIRFFEDIYGEDRLLVERHFLSKPIN